MKTTSLPLLASAALGLLALAPSAHGAVKIDSTTITASASSQVAADRHPGKLLDGETTGPNQVYVTPGGSPNVPADWRQNSTIANNQFAQGSSWLAAAGDVVDAWIILDLGADTPLATMNVFNTAVASGTNGNRSMQNADIYYMASADGPPSNTNLTLGALAIAEWTFLSNETFPEPNEGDTAMLATPVDFAGATARYVAFDVNSKYAGTFLGLGEVQFFEASAVVDDPVLSVDGGSPNPDFNFGLLFEGATAPTRTLTLINNSDSGTETVTINSVTVTNDAGGVFGTPVVTYSGTNVLANGDTVSIEIPASFAVAGTALGQVQILTSSSGGIVAPDFNDKLIPLQATVYTTGQKLNPNPFMESGLTDWDNLPGLGAVPVSPGLSGGSTGMARVKGLGDASGTITPASFMQSTGVPNGATDWQLSAFFTPIQAASAANDAAAAANFTSYVDPDGALGITEADGAFTDRTFQFVLLSADTGRPFPVFDNVQADGTILNIAYMPAGIQTDPTPDFYVYDSPSGEWKPTGIGEIQGSLDNDPDSDPLNGVGDGLLDTTTDPLDVINAYRLIVTGTGFGTASASYTITVTKFSGPDTFVSGTSAPLTFFQGAPGTTKTPAGYSFITSDISAGTNGSNLGDGTDPGFRTPFWVDDVCFFNGVGPDPLLTVVTPADTILVPPASTTGTTSVILRNDGISTPLDITAMDTGVSGFTVTSATSLMLAPGAITQVDIAWDSANSEFTPLYETGTLTITGSNFDPVVMPLEAGILFDHSVAIANGDFETPGTDPAGDTDTFADWQELLNATAITDVPGLISPSTTAAAMAAATTLTSRLVQDFTSPPLNNYVLEFDFSVASLAAPNNRELYFFVAGAGGRTNIGYNPGKFIAFDGLGSNSFKEVLAVTLTAGTPYHLKVVGNRWGTNTPTVTIEVFDAAGTPLATSAPFTYHQNGIPTTGANNLEFTTQFGGSAGVTVDEITISGQALDTTPPFTGPLLLENPALVPGSPNTVTADILGGIVDIYRSATGLPGSWVSTGVNAAAPGTSVVIDPNATLTPNALYIGVETGGTAP